LNPAQIKPKGFQAGALLMRNSRTSVLDHSAQPNGSKITSVVGDDIEEGGVTADLGAGAGISFTNQMQYHKVVTGTDQRAEDDLTEVTSTQHTAVKLAVELTNELQAALVVRYMYRDVTLFGSPFLDDGMETRFKVSLIGIGSGATYAVKNAGVGYAYFPPLHGKAEVSGEERIVIEPGQIVVSAFYAPTPKVTLGLLGKRWINEIDDLARGTTAPDNTTNISLSGNDPDQYVIPQQLLMVGVDVALTREATVRLGLGQESANFDFVNYQQIAGADVDQQGQLGVKTERASAVVRFVNQGTTVEGGGSYFTRQASFPDDWNGGSYKAIGTDLHVSVSLAL
jgi:hypothetical protein